MEDVSCIRLASISNKTSVVSVDANRVSLSVKPSHEFFEADIMGVEPPRRCGNCRKCKECTFIGQQCSQLEQYEYQVIDSKVYYDENEKCFRALYPFLDDPKILSENRGQVIKIAEREERKLEKEGLLQHFNEEFIKMITHGAIVQLSEEDMRMWKGATHYVSLQHVLKEDSPSTPLRIVPNSSLSDKRGISLNSILMKGPNTLSNQWDILNRWRVYEQGMCSDLTKAYWSIRTGEVEKHVRRVVWRYGDKSKPWETFAFCVVSFGDRPAAAILEIALKKTANLHSTVDPEVAQRIKDDRYVDDIVSGGNVAQVEKFVGSEEVSGPTSTLAQILSKGSFNVKVIVTSGESDVEKLRSLGRSVLGVGWDPPSDMITIDLVSNLGNAQSFKSVNYIADPSLDNRLSLIIRYTLRICLSIVNGIYDLLGLIVPITIRLKISFRDLFRLGLNLKWDDPIPQEDCLRWHELVCMLETAKSIAFPRATKPPNTVGNCELICYFDGSDFAYACVIYVKWTLVDGSVYIALVTSKSRVTPLLRISTPRSELNAAVLATRLILSTLRSWSPVEIPDRIWILGDSECTLSSIEKVNAAFGEYFGNRVGEILNNQAKIEEFCPVGENGEWYHVKSSDNGADIATRLDSTPDDIGPESEWQKGPSYLQLPRAEWPTNRDFAERKDDHIPHSELLKKYRGLIQAIEVRPSVGIDKLIDPYSTNDWNVLLRRTQNVMDAIKQLDRSKNSFVGQGIVDAKVLWFRSVTKDTIEAQNKGKLKELDLQYQDGMKVVVGRAKEGLRNFFGQNYLPVIMGSTRVAHLIMMAAHYKDHTGRDITQAMARHEAWIVNAKKLAKHIIKHCVRCRYLRKLLEEQKISVLPEFVQVMCPPFTNIGLDLVGPFIVKTMTNKKATMKVWVVIFLCLNTKAISMELAPGYSTEDFLLAYETYANQRGSPLIVHSDRGSQLVAAKKELCDEPLHYDWDAIAASTSRQGTVWKFAPAGAQWRNGATEAFVKKFKHSFLHLYQLN